MNAEIIFKEWSKKLSTISSEDWELFKWSDIEQKRIIYRGFWREREWKIDDRQPREGRFALKDIPVSWWAQDFSNAQSEKIPDLRKNKGRTLEDSINAIPSNYLCVDHRFLKANVALLDLRRETSPFYLSLKKYKLIDTAQEFIDNYISSEEKGCEEEVYPITQAIAECAFKNGYRAIVWNSARPYSDYGSRYGCVVVFDDGLLLNSIDSSLRENI